MKQLLIIFAAIGLLGLAAYPPPSSIIDEVTNAFAEGNAFALSAFLADPINLTSYNGEEASSKRASEQILGDFFADVAPEQFVEKHRGKSKKDQSTYLIGELRTLKGIFRVKLLIVQDQIVSLDIQTARVPI